MSTYRNVHSPKSHKIPKRLSQVKDAREGLIDVWGRYLPLLQQNIQPYVI